MLAAVVVALLTAGERPDFDVYAAAPEVFAPGQGLSAPARALFETAHVS